MQKPGIRRNLGAAVLTVPSAVPSDVRLFLCILSLALYPFYTTRFSMPPSRYEAIFFCTSPIRRVRASFDAQAMCGVMYRRSSSAIFSNGLSLRIGSLESTSIAGAALDVAEVTLIHDRAAADVDQNCVPLHVGKRFDIHQVLGRLI